MFLSSALGRIRVKNLVNEEKSEEMTQEEKRDVAMEEGRIVFMRCG